MLTVGEAVEPEWFQAVANRSGFLPIVLRSSLAGTTWRAGPEPGAHRRMRPGDRLVSGTPGEGADGRWNPRATPGLAQILECSFESLGIIGELAESGIAARTKQSARAIAAGRVLHRRFVRAAVVVVVDAPGPVGATVVRIVARLPQADRATAVLPGEEFAVALFGQPVSGIMVFHGTTILARIRMAQSPRSTAEGRCQGRRLRRVAVQCCKDRWIGQRGVGRFCCRPRASSPYPKASASSDDRAGSSADCGR